MSLKNEAHLKIKIKIKNSLSGSSRIGVILQLLVQNGFHLRRSLSVQKHHFMNSVVLMVLWSLKLIIERLK